MQIARASRFWQFHGPMSRNSGQAYCVLATGVAVLSLLTWLAFLAPQLLTTPHFRSLYDLQTIRFVVFLAAVAAGALCFVNLFYGRARGWSLGALGMNVAAICLAATPWSQSGTDPEQRLYIALDWLVFDLVGSVVVFGVVERIFALRGNQPLLRREWHIDLAYFAINHLCAGLVLIPAYAVASALVGESPVTGVRQWVHELPFPLAVIAILLLGDLIQYGAHRLYHEVPLLWRMHSRHHSATTLDFLSGSRQHIVELFLTRTLLLIPFLTMGFKDSVVDTFIIIGGLQAVLNHSNIRLDLGPLGRIFVSPNFHHWHHSSDARAINRNYAAHFAFLDRIFGTAMEEAGWPMDYGLSKAAFKVGP